MTLAPPQRNGADATPPPAGAWRNRDRYRCLGAELVGQPAVEPAAKPPAEPAADDDQISGFLGRDLAQPGGRVADGVAMIGRCCDARLAGEPLEHTVGVVAPAIFGDMGEHEAKAETVAQLGREPKRSTRLIAVGHTTHHDARPVPSRPLRFHHRAASPRYETGTIGRRPHLELDSHVRHVPLGPAPKRNGASARYPRDVPTASMVGRSAARAPYPHTQ
jgi:hypothetical protein